MPFVLVTTPVDRRLVTDARQVLEVPFVARAKVLGDASITAVEVRVDDSDWVPMAAVPGDTALWQTHVADPDGLRVYLSMFFKGGEHWNAGIAAAALMFSALLMPETKDAGAEADSLSSASVQQFAA